MFSDFFIKNTLFYIAVNLFFIYVNRKKKTPEQNSKSWWNFIGKLDIFYAVLLLLSAIFICIGIPNHEFIHKLKNMSIIFLIFIFFIFLNYLSRKNQPYLNRFWRIYNKITFILINIVVTYGVMLIFFAGILFVFDYEGVSNDICLDTGFCNEGVLLDKCLDDKPCIVNEKTCNLAKGKWFAARRACQF